MLNLDEHLNSQSIRTKTQLLIDLRLSYAVVSSSLVLLGFFWNNLQDFSGMFIILVMSIFFANVFIFIVNDFYDESQDSHDPAKRIRNVFCSPETNLLGKLVLYSSLSLSLFFGGLVSIPILLIIITFNILAFFYSAPPIKLRGRPYWDWIFVFLWKGLVIASGFVYFFGTNILAGNLFIYSTLVIILLFSLIAQLDNQVRDFTVDKINKSRHTVQLLGYGVSQVLKKILLVLFFTFSFVICYYFNLYITIALIFINSSLYNFVHPTKHHIVPDFALMWIVVLFMEYSVEFFSFRQQLLFSAWIVTMVNLTILHVKRTTLFETPRS